MSQRDSLREGLAEAGKFANSRQIQSGIALIAAVSALTGVFINPITGAVCAAALLVGLVAAFVYALRVRAAFDGPYDVLKNEVLWDMAAAYGATVDIVQRRYVRFNYRCSVIVERINGFPAGTVETLSPDYGEVIKRAPRPGGEEYAIVELAADKQRNEEAHLTYRLTATDAFASSQDRWIGHEFAKATEQADLEVRFPDGQRPQNVCIWRRSTEKTATVFECEGWDDSGPMALWREGGRYYFRLRERPKRDENYRITWDWS